MKPRIGIADDMRRGVVEILSTLLADEYVLYTKTRNYHWNVVGMQFNDLHKFFEAQYEALDEVIDEVAERARSLGGRALGTLAEFTERTRLKEEPKKSPDASRCWPTSSPITRRSCASCGRISRRPWTSSGTPAPTTS